MRNVFLGLLLPLGIASSASAVTMDWTPVSDPGNACDLQPSSSGTPGGGCFGSVSYPYSIGTYEVTNAQYAEFLNAKAKSDPRALYSQSMASRGGITRSGSTGTYVYSTVVGRADMPVNFVSFPDMLRFANWMNNGQGNGDTETGAYTLTGGTATPTNNGIVTRNLGATIFLPSENEWYKAAYYDKTTQSYFDYPSGFNTPTVCSAPTSAANRANCASAVAEFGGVTIVGSYTGSASPFGTFDQGGNVWEYTDTITGCCGLPTRAVRGGSYAGSDPGVVAASRRSTGVITNEALSEHDNYGFRLVMIPEPGTGLLVIGGLLGLAGRRKMIA